MKKPTIYIVSNFGGGVRKSTSIAHLSFALQDRGLDPIIVALDTNNTLENLLPEGSPIVKWDLNSETEGYEGMQAVLSESARTGRPVVLDLAALGGKTLGVETLLRTKMLDICNVVSVVPVLPTPKSISEATKALQAIAPNEWILVQYNTRNSSRVYEDMESFDALVKRKPVAIIKPSELTDDEARKLQMESAPLNKMHELTAVDPFGTLHLLIYTNYWSELSKQYKAALDTLNPKTDETPKPAKVSAS